MRVYKYELAVGEPTRVIFPGIDVRFLDAGVQDGNVVLWAQVDPTAKHATAVNFMVIPTGHMEVPTGMSYLGTAKSDGCQFVWHVYHESI